VESAEKTRFRALENVFDQEGVIEQVGTGQRAKKSMSFFRKKQKAKKSQERAGSQFTPLGATRDPPRGVYFLEFSSHFKKCERCHTWEILY